MNNNLDSFTDVLGEDIIFNSQPLSLPSTNDTANHSLSVKDPEAERPSRGTGQYGSFRSTEEIDPKYRDVFTYRYFNQVQSNVIDDALYSDTSLVLCAPTGSGKTVVFEMAIVQLLMDLEDKHYSDDFKIIYMAPVKALCTETLTEWYPKFTKLGLNCIEVTGDTDVDFGQLKPYKIIITTPEKWDILTRRWRDHKSLVEVIKLFLIDEVHILNDELRGPVLEAVVSRMKTIESSAQSAYRIDKMRKEIQGEDIPNTHPPHIRFVAVSATVSNPDDVARWLGSTDKPAKFYKYGDECRPVKLNRVVEGYPCPAGTNIFKFDLMLNYRLWPVIQKYHAGKPTLIFCNTRKSVLLTAEVLCKELTINFSPEQRAKLTALSATLKNKKLQTLVLSGVGCHHAGLLYEERMNIEMAFRNKDLPILITTTTLAMGVNLPAHLVIIKNTQQYVNGAFQEYSISTVLQMVGRAGRPQYDTEATAVIMTRLADKPRYQALLGGCEPLQSYLHKRLAENLNSEAALGSVGDVAQCVQWLRSTFLYVRALQDPKKYLGLPQNSPQHLISKKVEELCVRAMNGLATAGLITMDEASCIESTEAGRMMSVYYIDLETMKNIMKITGTESLEQVLSLVCDSHELADMHLRTEERRTLNALNRNNAAATIRFPMKGRISTRQMKLNCMIQSVLGCLPISDPSLNQEAMKIMRIADRICKCLVAYITRTDLISRQPQFYSAVLNSIVLAKCITAHLWENSPYVSKQMKGIGTAYSTLLATAGKVNFMLLEESHPRDLERLMNKGPPAGNILRKQITLLPKYQLTLNPVNEKTVKLKLQLQNLAYLMENLDSLTAGANHKAYIIVGDSRNNLLLLAAFKDKDLISVFDGTIIHEVTRKHNFEHKIFAHCISSTFVGIDVDVEYTFKDLETFLGEPCTTSKAIIHKVAEKQTHITDIYKKRKRKSPTERVNTVKNKKRKDNLFIDNFKFIKKTFNNVNSTVTTHDTNTINDVENYGQEIIEIDNEPNRREINKIEEVKDIIINSDDSTNIEDENIDAILFEIEKEMTGRDKLNNINQPENQNLDGKKYFQTNLSKAHFPFANNSNNRQNKVKPTDFKVKRPKCCKSTTKTNYTFIELLERNVDLSDDNLETSNKESGFSEAIKDQIQKYLQNTHDNTKNVDKTVEVILDSTGDESKNEMNSTLQSYPCNNETSKYEIKEILEPQNTSKLNDICIKQNSVSDGLSFIADSENCDRYNFEQNQYTMSSNYEATPCLELDSDTEAVHYPESNPKDIVMDVCVTNNTCTQREISQLTNNKKLDILVPADVNEVSPENILNQQTKNCFTGIIERSESNVSVCMPNLFDIKSNEIQKNDCIAVPIKLNKSHTQDPYSNFTKTPFENPSITDEKNMYFDNLSNTISYNVKPISNFNLPRDHKNKNECCMTKMIENNKGDSDVLYNNRNSNAEENINEKLSKLPKEKQVKEFLMYKNYCNSLSLNGNSTNCGTKVFSIETNLNRNIKEYKYSATKINVSNEQTANYHVQVIKRVKLDWNVTEIISPIPKHRRFTQSQKDNNDTIHFDMKTFQTSNKQIQNNTSIEKNDGAIKLGSIEDKSVEKIEKYSNHNFRMAQISNCSKTTPEISRPMFHSPVPRDKTNDYFQHKPSKVENKEHLSLCNVLSDVKQRPDITLNYTSNSANKEFQDDKSDSEELSQNVKSPQQVAQRTINAYKCPSINTTPNNKIQENNIQYKDIKTNENKTSNAAETTSLAINKDKTIQNILHKYVKILGSKKDNSEKKTPSQKYMLLTNEAITANVSEITKQSKTRRPFNITDIHRINSGIPKNILAKDIKANDVISKIDCKRETTHIPKNNQINENKFENRKIPTIRDNIPLHSQSNICTEEAVIYQPLPDIDIAPVPTTNIEEPTQNFNLDQSMFDPKTLLQCTFEDNPEEFIPPPPQFCDDSYSPEHDGIAYPIKNSFEETEISENYLEPKIDFNNSIFNERCPTTLSSSDEIETWALSREDAWENDNYNSMNLNSTKAFTVMRNNCTALNSNSLLRNNATSRHARLGKFKFNHKRKFIVKK